MLNKNINLNGKTVLVTGAAGFIGANLCYILLQNFSDMTILGFDCMNNYYDVCLKEYRLKQIEKMQKDSKSKFVFIQNDLTNKEILESLFLEYKPNIVVNLAAQAGVRYSISNPDSYIESNVIGFYNILEACRHSYDNGEKGVEHLIYASSSSVYGSNKKIPYSIDDKTDHPVSLYAATKKSNELFAHAYAKLYSIPITGLRFFTVYGPAGRPDMAYFSFTNKLLNHEKIQIFNYGNCKRDFTYIDDIVKGVIGVMQRTPRPDEEGVRCKVYNIGNSHPESLLDFVEILQDELKREGVLSEDFKFEKYMEFVGMQAGDVEITYADMKELEEDFGFKPTVDLRSGLRKFAAWYKEYYFN